MDETAAESEEEFYNSDISQPYDSDSSSESHRSGSVSLGSSAVGSEEDLQGQGTKRSEPSSDNVEEPAPKRRRRSYFSASNNLYIELLNDSIENAASGSCFDRREPLEDSHVGLTYWRAEEKETLLRTLEKCGEQGMSRVCHALPSKSEPEILQYVQLLRRGGLEHQVTQTRKKRFKFKDIPIAMEISRLCCTALNTKAERVRQRELCGEAYDEQMHFGENWLLDQGAAERLEEALEPDTSSLSGEDSNNAARSHPDPLGVLSKPLNLFDLPTWLRLSERVFMNPCDPKRDESWNSMEAEQLSETPAMFASALLDFYNLAESFVRRLVSAVIFQATSRLRASNSRSDRKPSFVVRQCDVFTAIDVLGVQQNSWKYWVGMPRRCRLSVYDVKEDRLPIKYSSRPSRTSPLKYDDVERIMQMSAAESKENSKSRRGSDETDAGNANMEEALKSPGNTTKQPTEGEEDASEPGDAASEHPRPRRRRDRSDALFRAEEAMADMLDLKASHHEEERLWRIVGPSDFQRMRSQQKLMEEDEDLDGITTEEVLTPRFANYKRSANDIIRNDWRYQVEEQQKGVEWERYGRFIQHGASAPDNISEDAGEEKPVSHQTVLHP